MLVYLVIIQMHIAFGQVENFQTQIFSLKELAQTRCIEGLLSVRELLSIVLPYFTRGKSGISTVYSGIGIIFFGKSSGKFSK